jgi:hypothetical protein
MADIPDIRTVIGVIAVVAVTWIMLVGLRSMGGASALLLLAGFRLGLRALIRRWTKAGRFAGRWMNFSWQRAVEEITESGRSGKGAIAAKPGGSTLLRHALE